MSHFLLDINRMYHIFERVYVFGLINVHTSQQRHFDKLANIIVVAFLYDTISL